MEVATGATGATGSLLMKLGELLQDEYNLKDKVKKDIESIQHELIFVNATLRVMEEVPLDQLDEQAQVWVIFIKELSYDMSDIVSTFFVRVLVVPYLPGFIRKAFNMLCMGMNHHQIAGMVKEIRSLIKEVTELRERYRLDDIVTRPITPVVLPQRENMWTRYLAADYEEVARQDISITYEEPMAVEEDMKVLHNWITSGDGNDCMCLVGPGGVGKTTIAMALYRNYGDQFQRRVMINGSHASGESEAVFVDILNQLKSQELQAHDGDAHKIRAELRECLQGKRFLILLDDVRSKYVFYEIRSLLSDIEKGSRVLVTTRFEAVAREFKRYRRDCVHEVGLLSDEKARQLFMEVVGKENKEKIPAILWEICRGLPLAIITVANHVACNPEKTENEWRMFCSSLQPSTSTSNTTYQLMKVLRTCYIDMPLDIKMCALYLSMFPRGRKIRKKYLTRQLISQGFVIEQQGLSVEEVAETYFHHLIRRKFIRATEHGSNGKVKSYQVHDLVLEYIVSEASRVNFATTFGGCRPPFGSKVRRFFANYNISLEHGERVEMMNLSHVRYLSMFGSLNKLPLSSFKFGRFVEVLDLEGCKDVKQQHIKEICRMLLLRYLSLRKTDIKKLTKRIGDLLLLETLDIRETDVIELPNAICNLEELVNIFGGNKRTRKGFKLPRELGKRGKMKALRILTGIEISEERSGAANLHQLTNLMKLAIYNLNINKEGSNYNELSSPIEYIGGYSLRALVIHDESAEFLKSLGQLSSPPKLLNALELSGKLIELPKWITELDALTKLTLSVTALRADNLEVLSKICTLFSLTFSLNAAKQDEETAAIIEDNKACSDGVILFSVGGFENLKLLRLSAPYVPRLSFPDGALPTLERLELRFSNFEGLVGIRGLKNIQQVYIKVQDEASETTESIIKEMATAAREDRDGPRIIVD